MRFDYVFSLYLLSPTAIVDLGSVINPDWLMLIAQALIAQKVLKFVDNVCIPGKQVSERFGANYPT